MRSLAHDLGQALGTGGHLTALRRTATTGVTIVEAITLEQLEQAQAPAEAVMPMDRLLPHLPAVVLTAEGARKAVHGQELGPADAVSGFGLDGRQPPASTRPGRFAVSPNCRSARGFCTPP